jgi:hypothetical protein
MLAYLKIILFGEKIMRNNSCANWGFFFYFGFLNQGLFACGSFLKS